MKRHVLLLSVACFAAQLGISQTLHVLASNGIRSLIEEVQPAAEKAAGRKLVMVYDSTTALKAKIAAGEKFDVAIMTKEGIDDLVAAKKVVFGVPIARVGIGVGVRSGTPMPDIGTHHALKETLLKAKSITYAQDGASRPFIEHMFADFVIDDQIKRKIAAVQGSTNATARVAKGKSEMVLTLISEIIPVKGLLLVGPFPDAVQHYISFSEGVSTNTSNRTSADALMAFLWSPEIEPLLKTKGMEPWPRGAFTLAP